MARRFFNITGFREGVRSGVITTDSLRGKVTEFDGKKLDEVQVISTIKSQADVDQLIDFLRVTKTCLPTQ